MANAVTSLVTSLSESELFDDVLGVVDTARLKSWPRTPSAFVFTLSDESAGSLASRSVNGVQRLTTTVAVQLLIETKNDAHGSRDRGEFHELLNATRARILATGIDGIDGSIGFARGYLLGIESGRIEWRDEYRITSWLSQGATI